MANKQYALEDVADMHEFVIFDTCALFNAGMSIGRGHWNKYFNVHEPKKMSSNSARFSRFYDILRKRHEICTVPEVSEEFKDMVQAAKIAHRQNISLREDLTFLDNPPQRRISGLAKGATKIKKLGLKIMDIDIELRRRHLKTSPEVYSRTLELTRFSAENYVKYISSSADCHPDPKGTDEAIVAAAYSCAFQRIGSAAIVTNDRRIGYVAQGINLVFRNMLNEENGHFAEYNVLDSFVDFTPRVYSFESLKRVSETRRESTGVIPAEKIEAGIALVRNIEKCAPARAYNFSNASVQDKP